MAIFLAEQQRLAEPQAVDGQAQPERDPDQVHPERRLEHQLDEDRAKDQERADDQDQERRRAVADIEGGKIEAAAAALAGKADPAVEQGARAAARDMRRRSAAASGEGSLTGGPHPAPQPWIGAPQPPHT